MRNKSTKGKEEREQTMEPANVGGAGQGGCQDDRPIERGGDLSDGRRVAEHNKGREGDFDLWKRDAAMSGEIPPNSALWSHSPMSKPTYQHLPPDSRPLEETLTTLPLPGDAPNPLSVLAEASTDARSERDRPTPSTDAYYAPVARVLRDDAPHIMTLISVQE
jgi:hypothetical protein